MQCPGCGYALWNLTDHRCPECGRTFRVREFSFPAESASFACPACQHEHEGDTEPHHWPSADDTFECHACGEAINTDTLRVVPLGDPADIYVTPSQRVPWETKGANCFISWVATIAWVITRPKLVGRLITPVTKPNGLTFAFWTSFMGMMIAAYTMLPLLLITEGRSDLSLSSPADLLEVVTQVLGAMLLLATWAIPAFFVSMAILFLIGLPAAFLLHLLMQCAGRQVTFDQVLAATQYGQASTIFVVLAPAAVIINSYLSILIALLILSAIPYTLIIAFHMPQAHRTGTA